MKKDVGMAEITVVMALLGVSAVMILTVAAVCIAAQMSPPQDGPSWAEHLDMVNLVLYGLIVMLVWFTIRLIRKYDKNQDIMFERVTALSRDFYTLQGEHNGILRKGGHK